MTMIEVAESEYKALKDVQTMVDSLWNDPEKGLKVKELVKEKYPNANIPELDAVRFAREEGTKARTASEEASKLMAERLEKMEASLKERDDAFKAREEEAKFEAEVERVRKAHSFTTEGMEKVFARMKEKNNPDIESAAAWVLAQEPKQSPADNNLFSPSNMDMYGANSGSDEWKELNQAVLNNKVDSWFDRTAQKVLSEFEQR